MDGFQFDLVLGAFLEVAAGKRQRGGGPFQPDEQFTAITFGFDFDEDPLGVGDGFHSTTMSSIGTSVASSAGATIAGAEGSS